MALVRLAALWKPKEKKSYGLSGMSGDVVYYIFPNDKKKESNHPDYFLCVGAKAKEDEGGEEPKTTNTDLPF